MISLADIPKSQHHAHAHALLRECMKRLGTDTADAPMTYGEYGKPSFRDLPDVHFNLSHADGIAACIVTDTECGIDCERVREYRPRVMQRSFTAEEIRLVEESENRDLMFFRLWTLKEAYVKAVGVGISYPMNTISFSFDGTRIVTNITGYSFAQYLLRGGQYTVSVCRKTE